MGGKGKPSRKGHTPRPPEKSPAKGRLLSGGNPQIPKGDGDAPVQEYISRMPGWKSDVGRRLDALITRVVPGVRKAVRWNSPFYGSDTGGWFLCIHVYTHFVKVTFFRGTSLSQAPTGCTPKSGECRWVDLRENDPPDDERMESWVRQAAELPGWVM